MSPTSSCNERGGSIFGRPVGVGSGLEQQSSDLCVTLGSSQKQGSMTSASSIDQSRRLIHCRTSLDKSLDTLKVPRISSMMQRSHCIGTWNVCFGTSSDENGQDLDLPLHGSHSESAVALHILSINIHSMTIHHAYEELHCSNIALCSSDHERSAATLHVFSLGVFFHRSVRLPLTCDPCSSIRISPESDQMGQNSTRLTIWMPCSKMNRL
mmetsp:Transcript_41411/g.53435  ORF Transcript_41411/g.53435 Transcript_41411/m.53435 type:complete len:211 (-) Transcript_41411:604-1236(-)